MTSGRTPSFSPTMHMPGTSIVFSLSARSTVHKALAQASKPGFDAARIMRFAVRAPGALELMESGVNQRAVVCAASFSQPSGSFASAIRACQAAVFFSEAETLQSHAMKRERREGC